MSGSPRQPPRGFKTGGPENKGRMPEQTMDGVPPCGKRRPWSRFEIAHPSKMEYNKAANQTSGAGESYDTGNRAIVSAGDESGRF